jgi:hypothetical protein
VIHGQSGKYDIGRVRENLLTNFVNVIGVSAVPRSDAEFLNRN